VVVRNQAGEHCSNNDIKNRADDERSQDANRHVLGWVLGLLGRSGNSVEPNIGKKDNTRGTQDSGPAKLPERAGIFRNERMPILSREMWMLHQEACAHDNKNNEYANLDYNNCGVEVRRFLDADHQDNCRDGNGKKTEEVESSKSVRQ